ncbi:MAG TPA: DUF1361 domain-containing protein [Flavisolibacter sp.]|nr:DUF1361 domain-containing protein [Flavisolibacter sp.]
MNTISSERAGRNGAGQVLLLCTVFSMALLGFRMIYTGSHLFVFLAWNLFLAWIPYAVMMRLCSKQRKDWQLLTGGLVWLLFLPNSFYLVTDLFHLDMNQFVPLWYDLALLFAFAWNGILFGLLSLNMAERLLENRLGKKPGLYFLLPVMALNGLGVYVGRYLRFNSWDVLPIPFS